MTEELNVNRDSDWAQMDDDVKRMRISEFCELGLLQEVNRLFFHPLGLALEVVIEEDGTQHLGGIWDYREDQEGIYFGPGEIEDSKKRPRLLMYRDHEEIRKQLFGGSAIQDR